MRTVENFTALFFTCYTVVILERIAYRNFALRYLRVNNR